MRKAPMTAAEATEILAMMQRDTPENSQRSIIKLALGRFGNLTKEAKAHYRKRLAELCAS